MYIVHLRSQQLTFRRAKNASRAPFSSWSNLRLNFTANDESLRALSKSSSARFTSSRSAGLRAPSGVLAATGVRAAARRAPAGTADGVRAAAGVEAADGVEAAARRATAGVGAAAGFGAAAGVGAADGVGAASRKDL